MKPKKTNIKIKRRKYNLYNKKKSKSRQVLSIVVTIAAACVLGVVGYGVGKPIMNYLQNRGQYVSGDSSSSSEESSQGSQSSQNSSQESSDSSAPESTSSVESVPSEPVVTDSRMYVLPEDAAKSSASLSGALAAAKESGFGVAVVTLKNEDGMLYYKSEVPTAKDNEFIDGALTAEQICDYITKAGMIPAARISTLKDNKAPWAAGGYRIVSGGGWLDDYPDRGGKQWLSPFSEDAVNYIGGICGELSAAGFKHIICKNTMYPVFHGVDISTYLNNLPLSDKTKRVEALWKTIDAAKAGAEKNGAELWLEFDGKSVTAEETSGTDAELCADKTKLANVNVIADYSAGGENAYQTALDFADKLKQSGGKSVAVLVKNGLSADAQKAFGEAGVEVFRES